MYTRGVERHGGGKGHTGKEGGFFVVVENILLFGYNTFVHAVFLIVAFKLY